MNPTAIFSKSGKGVQEASGKTSQLSRPDRAVLSAIDGRATLAEVAGKVGKQFDNDFRAVITKLDKDGFIREVSPGAAAPAKPGAAPAKPAAKPTAPMEAASDLDFTATMAISPKKGAAAPPPQAISRAPAPPPKPINIPPPPPPPSAAEVAKKAEIAKDQQSAFARAREEAEQKAQEQRDRVKAEAEAKVRAETEAKLRDEAEKKFKAEAEAAAKRAEAEAAAARSAAIRAAAEAKIKAEAEAKRAREEAERAKREAEEKAERARKEAEAKAERARKEAEEKARREQEELKRKLEEERRAREEAERKAKEEAERARRELEEERRKMEAERQEREEQARREEAERAARRQREEEDEQERRRQRDAQDEAERAERLKQQEEQTRAEEEAARKVAENELSFDKLMAAQATPEPAAPPPAPKQEPKQAPTGDAFADSLLADLDSFTQRDDEERKAKEAADKKSKEEAARKVKDEADRQAREAAEARQREEDERRRKEEEKQRLREAEEARVRKVKEEQEQAEREAEERRKKIAAASPTAPGGDDIGITDSDLDMSEVNKEAALLEKKKDRKAEREKEREKEKARKRESEREAKAKKEKEREEKEAKKAAAYRPRRKSNLGRNLFLTLILLAVVGVGVAHVIPLSTADYERAATEALGRPVRIASGNFSLIGGAQYRFEGVTIGNDFKVPTVRAFPELGSLISDRKTWTRIELEGLTLPQDALGDVLFAKGAGDSLRVPQLTLKNLRLAGPLPLPPLDGEVQLAGGGIRSAALRGPEGLVARLGVKDQGALEFDVSTAQFTLPFAPGITLIQFSMKGDANRSGMKISQWDGLLFSGKVAGTANLRWGNTWNLDGVITARGMNAAVFAPALVSDGRADGTGRFSMSGVEPAKLHTGARLEGNFTVMKGVLGSVDLGRALQTGGRVIAGQTQFGEMSGQGVFDRGQVSIRNVNLGAGALNAGASLDITERGELSGRIVADVRTSTQNLRSTLILGGTVQEPQVRN